MGRERERERQKLLRGKSRERVQPNEYNEKMMPNRKTSKTREKQFENCLYSVCAMLLTSNYHFLSCIQPNKLISAAAKCHQDVQWSTSEESVCTLYTIAIVLTSFWRNWFAYFRHFICLLANILYIYLHVPALILSITKRVWIAKHNFPLLQLLNTLPTLDKI